MLSNIWNPWHGCIKYSEGCKYCYMYYLDKQRDKDGSKIYKVKTNFNLPLKKNKNGEYKIPSGSLVHVCMTSDFFLSEADPWRDEVWSIIKKRNDLTFWIQTKRAERVRECLPNDWNENGYDNVIFCFTTENQKRADERIPILLNLPIKRRVVMCAPMISEITLEKYLKTNLIEQVLVDGENYDGNRPLYYKWVKRLYDECLEYNVKFTFCGTGNYFVKDNITYHIVKAYQGVMARRSHLQIPDYSINLKLQPKCKTCKRNNSCNGCNWCNRCIKK